MKKTGFGIEIKQNMRVNRVQPSMEVKSSVMSLHHSRPGVGVCMLVVLLYISLYNLNQALVLKYSFCIFYVTFPVRCPTIQFTYSTLLTKRYSFVKLKYGKDNQRQLQNYRNFVQYQLHNDNSSPRGI